MHGPPTAAISVALRLYWHKVASACAALLRIDRIRGMLRPTCTCPGKELWDRIRKERLMA